MQYSATDSIVMTPRNLVPEMGSQGSVGAWEACIAPFLPGNYCDANSGYQEKRHYPSSNDKIDKRSQFEYNRSQDENDT